MDSYVFRTFEDFFGKITGWTDFYILDIYYGRLWIFMKIHIFEDIINKNRISIENCSINLILHKELHFTYFIYFFFLHILFIIYILFYYFIYILEESAVYVLYRVFKMKLFEIRMIYRVHHSD